MMRLILLLALLLAGCGGGGDAATDDNQVEADCTAVPPCLPVAHVGGMAR